VGSHTATSQQGISLPAHSQVVPEPNIPVFFPVSRELSRVVQVHRNICGHAIPVKSRSVLAPKQLYRLVHEFPCDLSCCNFVSRPPCLRSVAYVAKSITTLQAREFANRVNRPSIGDSRFGLK
jgi:hypothetical protein